MSALTRRGLFGLTVLGGVSALTACGSSGSDGSGASPSAPAAAGASGGPTGSGRVNVLYAGSLVNLMEKQLGPAFATATGYTFAGFGAGSTALAAQIKGKVRKADVFVSASPKADEALMGAGNGDWVRWYVTYANSPLVLGYNPRSTFVDEIKTGPWYDAITRDGVRVGTTDPKTDPKGKLAAQALADTGKQHPKLLDIARDDKTIFPEETLVADLQSGQLDAGFFYSSEAKAAGIPTVPLAGVSLQATYTVTVLKDAPNAAGAEAFVTYLLGPAGTTVLRQDGYELTTPPKVTGTGVPAAIRKVIGA
ncbi:extracellular solute-binding protein [Flexivirga sp. ID2601S]|uniref:Extracellular solute-binding protein n=1 Tax=Flexivirga aerilata TaxID=1656889 RepID=A0A849AIX7_9MICO|nr:extracellular solute-binding protein [Flexivirga aerilata]NNG38360.1 extracellular solute-binding protein [Flexivirga aerilata]